MFTQLWFRQSNVLGLFVWVAFGFGGFQHLTQY